MRGRRRGRPDSVKQYRSALRFGLSALTGVAKKRNLDVDNGGVAG